MTRKAWNRSTQEDFLERAAATHGDVYDYSKSEYVSYHAKVIVICRKHGEFLQKPAHHLAGIGCPACGIETTAEKLKSSLEDFIERSVAIHGSKYDYSKVSYKNMNVKIEIICPEHGSWHVIPASHVKGMGCTGCAGYGFNTMKPATLYTLTCGDITKVGITNQDPNLRAKQIGSGFGAEFSILKLVEFKDGGMCLDAETKILQHLRKDYQNPVARFRGFTECFMNVDRRKLMQDINELVEAQYAE